MTAQLHSRRRWLAGLAGAPLLVLAGAPARAASPAQIYRRSYELEAKGEYAAALKALDGLPKSSRGYVYRLRRGWLLYLMGRNFDAMEEYRRAIALEPDAVEPRLGLMLPQIALKLWLDTLKTGKQVLARDAHNYTAHARMAWAAYNLARYQEAAEHYRHNLALYPSDVEMRAGLGYCHLKRGETKAAAREFRRVLEVAPDHGSAQAGLLAAER